MGVWPKTKFSMVVPPLAEKLKEMPERRSIVLFGIEVLTGRSVGKDKESVDGRPHRVSPTHRPSFRFSPSGTRVCAADGD